MKKTTTALEMRQRFGGMMLDARRSRGLTVDAVAKKVGTHKGYISSVERAKVAPPRPPIVRRWARILGVPVTQALAYRQLSDIPQDLPLSELETVIGSYLGQKAAPLAPAPTEQVG